MPVAYHYVYKVILTVQEKPVTDLSLTGMNKVTPSDRVSGILRGIYSLSVPVVSIMFRGTGRLTGLRLRVLSGITSLIYVILSCKKFQFI